MIINISPLVKAWEKFNDLKAQVTYLKAMIEQSPETQKLRVITDELKECNTTFDRISDAITAEAIALYTASGEKHPHPGVEVKIFKIPTYDESKALDWCITNLPGAIKCDFKLFEKHAKAVAETKPIDFVTIIDTPRVSILADLSQFIEPKKE